MNTDQAIESIKAVVAENTRLAGEVQKLQKRAELAERERKSNFDEAAALRGTVQNLREELSHVKELRARAETAYDEQCQVVKGLRAALRAEVRDGGTDAPPAAGPAREEPLAAQVVGSSASPVTCTKCGRTYTGGHIGRCICGNVFAAVAAAKAEDARA